MKPITSLVLSVLLLVAGCGPSSDASSGAVSGEPGASLQGAWRIAEVVGQGGQVTNPLGLYIFTGSHYSIMTAGQLPRATFAAVDGTDTEKLAAYSSFTANAGSYEINGISVTVRPLVSKYPNLMGGGFNTFEFRMASDTLWLSASSANIRFMVDGQLVPDTVDPPVGSMIKLIRLD